MKTVDFDSIFMTGVTFSRYELARIFNVCVPKITANIKAIIKSNAVKPDYDGVLVQIGKSLLPEVYDIEMVVALAFRINTAESAKIRKLILRKVLSKPVEPRFFIKLNSRNASN